ncbi:hypothetical protein LTR53_017347, partial [Teratosphaeriaceae sp. CCFEE 6253]
NLVLADLVVVLDFRREATRRHRELALLAANRQIHAETAPIFYHSAFIVSVADRTFARYLAHLAPATRALITAFHGQPVPWCRFPGHARPGGMVVLCGCFWARYP